MRIQTVALVLFGTVACGAGRRAPELAVPARQSITGSEGAMLRAILDAKAAIDSGARARDFSRALFAADDSTELVTQAGERLVGREAIGAWVARLREGGRLVEHVQLDPVRYDYCTNSVIERDGTYLVPVVAPAGDDTLRGRYSARWVVGEDGSAHLRRIDLVAAGTRPPRIAECPSRNWAGVRQSRWRISVAPPYIGKEQSVLADDFTRKTAQLGYGGGRLVGKYGTLDGYEGTMEPRAAAFGLVALRYRVRGSFALQLQQSLRPIRTRMQAYNAGTKTHLTLTDESRSSQAIVTWDWRHFNVGAGGIMVANQWHQREVPMDRSLGDWTYIGPATDQAWSSTNVGAVAQAGYTIPVFWRFSADLFGQYRGMTSAKIPATQRREAMTLQTSGFALGLAIGLNL